MTRPTPAEIEEAVERAREYVAHYDGADVTNTSENMANARALLAVVAERDEAHAAVRANLPETRKVVEQRTAERIAAFVDSLTYTWEIKPLTVDEIAERIRAGAWRKGASDADE